MVFGVPVLLVVGGLVLMVFAALGGSGTSDKKDITVNIDGRTYTGTLRRKDD